MAWTSPHTLPWWFWYVLNLQLPQRLCDLCLLSKISRCLICSDVACAISAGDKVWSMWLVPPAPWIVPLSSCSEVYLRAVRDSRQGKPWCQKFTMSRCENAPSEQICLKSDFIETNTEKIIPKDFRIPVSVERNIVWAEAAHSLATSWLTSSLFPHNPKHQAPVWLFWI